MNSANQVWHAHPWVVALDDDTLYRGKFVAGGEEAAEKIRAGASPKDVFGWTGRSLTLANVRSAEWVPAVSTLLVKRSDSQFPGTPRPGEHARPAEPLARVSAAALLVCCS